MTSDELTRRAIIAAHDAECSDRCDITVMPSLNPREAGIVEALRQDLELVREQAASIARARDLYAANAQEQAARAEAAEQARDHAIDQRDQWQQRYEQRQAAERGAWLSGEEP